MTPSLPLTGVKKEKKTDFDKEAHHRLARKAVAQSIVMLKNDVDPVPILPLKEGTRVALIGDFAKTPRYQGAGSSMVNPTKVETMAEKISEYPLTCLGCARKGYRRTGEADEELKKTALDLAASADVVIYCFGLDEISESEGLDRTHMRIPQNQIELLEALVKVKSEYRRCAECRFRDRDALALLLQSDPSRIPWRTGWGRGQCSMFLPGKRILRAGLSETYPIRYEDTPAFRNFPSTERNSEYRESIFVGYRYYDTSKVRVQYPFGYGLSYTEFTYSDLKVTDQGAEFVIANTGSMDGAEVAPALCRRARTRGSSVRIRN